MTPRSRPNFAPRSCPGRRSCDRTPAASPRCTSRGWPFLEPEVNNQSVNFVSYVTRLKMNYLFRIQVLRVEEKVEGVRGGGGVAGREEVLLVLVELAQLRVGRAARALPPRPGTLR